MASLHPPTKSENIVLRPFPSHSISQYPALGRSLPPFSHMRALGLQSTPNLSMSNGTLSPWLQKICSMNIYLTNQSHRDPKSSSLQSLVKPMATASQATQPVASRSNVQLPYALAPTRTGTAKKMAAIADDHIARVGIKVQLSSALTRGRRWGLSWSRPRSLRWT